jgi:predicted signal transduction protein with EAL and GGDEF domain/CheY-like chemotaxis protein
MTPALTAADDLPSPGNAPAVLLVDDDPTTLLLTGLALRERGFQIVECESGERALEVLSQRAPDLVVLDALMPGLDGFDTCRALRRMVGLENVPVLMLTGLDDDSSVQRALDAGATDFLVKSTQWSLLALRLQFLLRASSTVIELERSHAKLARAQDLARMGSFDWRRPGGLLLSPEALRMLGLAGAGRTGLRALLRMVPRDERRALLRLLHDTLRQSLVLNVDVPVAQLNGSQRIIHIEAEPEFNEHGQSVGYTGVAQDVTDRRAAEDQILHLANFDTLTGLPNRHQLISRAQRAMEMARRMQHQFALLLIDLDRFKVINDTLGHGAGDELLMEVGRRLRGCVRHSDQVIEGTLESAGLRSHRALEAVARLGGDEFVALLPEVAADGDAERVAQRMLEVMRDPIFVAGQECFVTASVGVAIFPRDGATVADLLRNADVAMYSVKTEGRNGAAIYSPSLAGRGREKLELESALHKAIERDELVLHYQPRVDVRNAQVVGVEALMRWQRGDRLVPPGDFIPLAEETGLIVPLSEWALREAARQSKAWRESFGFADSIAVNLPSRLFARSDLVEHIHQCVSAVGLPHRAIMLEITEDNLMKDLENLVPPLHRLNEIGVEIAIDDFGTGHSSLARLATLPLSELKIDRSFVSELGVKAQSSAIVGAIIALARALHLRVVAEGVETTRQMEVLHRLDCTLMQGFLFSRALPSDKLEHWLQTTTLPSLGDSVPLAGRRHG